MDHTYGGLIRYESDGRVVLSIAGMEIEGWRIDDQFNALFPTPEKAAEEVEVEVLDACGIGFDPHFEHPVWRALSRAKLDAMEDAGVSRAIALDWVRERSPELASYLEGVESAGPDGQSPALQAISLQAMRILLRARKNENS